MSSTFTAAELKKKAAAAAQAAKNHRFVQNRNDPSAIDYEVKSNEGSAKKIARGYFESNFRKFRAPAMWALLDEPDQRGLIENLAKVHEEAWGTNVTRYWIAHAMPDLAIDEQLYHQRLDAQHIQAKIDARRVAIEVEPH